MFNYFPEMFPINRFEIKFIGHIKIGRNCFRVTIHHDGFITTFFYGKQTMHTAIIKFNSLPNPVWTGTKYNYFFLI